MENIYVVSTGDWDYGKEIIKYLQKLGGENKFDLGGNAIGSKYYFIKDGIIDYHITPPENSREINLKRIIKLERILKV
jgi:hypothetical protein